MTLVFREIISAAKAGDAELTSSLVALLPPRHAMPPAAKQLHREILEQYGRLIRNNHDPIDPIQHGAIRARRHAWPRISVITPSFNQGKYIRETIESVISQGYPNLEYIVVDGGSTDETVSVIMDYADKLSHWVSERDRGQSDAINKGFRRASGEILTWLNSDDQLAPDALFHMGLAFATSDADLVAGVCEVHENGELRHRHLTSCADGPLPVDAILDLENGWNAGQFFFQPEVFFRRNLWERAGSHVREDCYYSMDYELWCRFAALGAKLRVIGVPIVNFRSHPEQKTADPDKFKAELIPVQQKFITEWLGGSRPLLDRPPQNPSKRVKVAMINDHGFRYGAGIAHQRIAAAFDLAGFEVVAISVKDHMSPNSDLHSIVDEMVREVDSCAPDIVVFGNLHSHCKREADLVFEIQKKYRTFWLTHDFWLFTGRCPYTGDCSKYLTGCDHHCPTADEYPALPHDEIAGAWRRKRNQLAASRNLTILANSSWAKAFSEAYLSSFENRIAVERIQLGVPVNQFFPTDRGEARRRRGISGDSFTIAFSVSSISESRKGADILEAALHLLPSEDITLLLIGNCDDVLDLPDVNVVKLGYVESNDLLLEALNAADVFVGPSREETLGQVFLEAAMCGTPSIGFAGSGVGDAIIDGVTGLLVKERTPVHLAAAILTLIRDPEHRARLGRTAHLHARSHFSLESSFRSFFEVFKNQGLIDQWCLPHKITFQKQSAFAGNSYWAPVKGLSLAEGPYPEHGIDHPFRWCHGDHISIEITCKDASRVVFSCKNPLFESQRLVFLAGDCELGILQLARHEHREIQLTLPLERSNLVIEIQPSHKLEQPDASKRHLAFMLVGVDVSF